MEKGRQKALETLVLLSQPLADIRAALKVLSWDSEDELVTLTKRNVMDILSRYLSGELSATVVEDWANIIEGRDDVGFATSDASALRDVVNELANPTVTTALTDKRAREIISALTGAV